MTGITFLQCDVTDRRFSGLAGIYGYAFAKGAIAALIRTLAP